MNRRAARLFLQTLLGAVILGSAIGKAFDLPGFVAVLVTYRAFPSFSLWPVAIVVTVFEAVLGGLLLSGKRIREAALASIALNAGYAIWLTLSLARGLDLKNCGCFGIFLARPLTWQSPLEDLVMVALSAALFRLAVAPVRRNDTEAHA